MGIGNWNASCRTPRRRRETYAALVPGRVSKGCSVASRFDMCQYRYMSKSVLCSNGTALPDRAVGTRTTVRKCGRGDGGDFKALSDPARLRLLSPIASHSGGEACVCDISKGIDLTQPTISHHLKVLRDGRTAEIRAPRLMGVLRGSSGGAAQLCHPADRERRPRDLEEVHRDDRHRRPTPSTPRWSQAFTAGPVPAGVDRPRHGRGPAAGPGDPRPEHRAAAQSRSTASRCRSPSGCWS